MAFKTVLFQEKAPKPVQFGSRLLYQRLTSRLLSTQLKDFRENYTFLTREVLFEPRGSQVRFFLAFSVVVQPIAPHGLKKIGKVLRENRSLE